MKLKKLCLGLFFVGFIIVGLPVLSYVYGERDIEIYEYNKIYPPNYFCTNTNALQDILSSNVYGNFFVLNENILQTKFQYRQ